MRNTLAFSAIAALLLVSVAAQECNECQSSNDALCLSTTEYKNCMNNVAIGDTATCPTGTVCSNTAEVCVKSESVDGVNILDVCGGSSGGSSEGNGENCGVCIGSGKFACVSKTQYARCVDQKVSTTPYPCGTDETCITEALGTYGTLCVPNCALTFIGLSASTSTCSNADYTPPTVPSVPTQTELEAACALSVKTTTFFDIDNTADTTCSSYIYCEKLTESTWLAILYSCKSPTPYYSVDANKCTATKPTRCTTQAQT
ncbi:GL25086 [Drosophila persimilis]|uniref:GL25086 n=1 Tax=Drosophila persimilis TaxID=7234 RepID=B4GQU5_DROPE|nr:uncharacterized protein LOC6596024 [Drosophila persimilis]EDW40130.1 GL25086 [Drosophila persimilis]